MLSEPCATFRLHGARGGGVRRGGGRNILPSNPVAAKETSPDGGGIRVSSQGEALEKAAVGTVEERGGVALDPTLNQTKAGALRGPVCGASCWGWSGAWGGVGERQRGVLVADSLVGIHPHPGPTRRGVRSRGEGRRRRNEARDGEEEERGQEGGAFGGGDGGGSSGVDGVAVGSYLECEEVECEGNEQEEAEKCGGKCEAGKMGDGAAN